MTYTGLDFWDVLIWGLVVVVIIIVIIVTIVAVYYFYRVRLVYGAVSQVKNPDGGPKDPAFSGEFVESGSTKDERPTSKSKPASDQSNKIDPLSSFSQKRGVKLFLDLRRARRNVPTPPVNQAADHLEEVLDAGAGEG